VDVFALARAKREVQEIVEREWSAAGGKMLGRKRAARFLKEGVQNNREGIERPHDVNGEPVPFRISAPTKPTLLLQPGDSSDNRILDIETQWNPTDTDGEEGPTNLLLVRPEENPVAARTATSPRKNRKANKQRADKKSDTKGDSNSGMKKKEAKHEASKETPTPVDKPDEAQGVPLRMRIPTFQLSLGPEDRRAVPPIQVLRSGYLHPA